MKQGVYNSDILSRKCWRTLVIKLFALIAFLFVKINILLPFNERLVKKQIVIWLFTQWSKIVILVTFDILYRLLNSSSIVKLDFSHTSISINLYFFDQVLNFWFVFFEFTIWKFLVKISFVFFAIFITPIVIMVSFLNVL